MVVVSHQVWMLGTKLWSPEEQEDFLTAEPSLSPLFSLLSKYYKFQKALGDSHVRAVT